jgi:predicted amidophosphoribosyltransferase
MTRARRRERGFNQAELLARGLSRRSGWPIEPLLIRTGGGPPLARLGRTRRGETVRQAFAVRAPTGGGSGRDLTGCDALLVDDVITTGATAAACAEALADAGVRCHGVVSFSRADPLDDVG